MKRVMTTELVVWYIHACSAKNKIIVVRMAQRGCGMRELGSQSYSLNLHQHLWAQHAPQQSASHPRSCLAHSLWMSAAACPGLQHGTLGWLAGLQRAFKCLKLWRAPSGPSCSHACRLKLLGQQLWFWGLPPGSHSVGRQVSNVFLTPKVPSYPWKRGLELNCMENSELNSSQQQYRFRQRSPVALPLETWKCRELQCNFREIVTGAHVIFLSGLILNVKVLIKIEGKLSLEWLFCRSHPWLFGISSAILFLFSLFLGLFRQEQICILLFVLLPYHLKSSSALYSSHHNCEKYPERSAVTSGEEKQQKQMGL